MKNAQEYIEELEAALIDILDGNAKPNEIQYNTGLSEERCEEISNLFEEVLKNYKEKHNI